MQPQASGLRAQSYHANNLGSTRNFEELSVPQQVHDQNNMIAPGAILTPETVATGNELAQTVKDDLNTAIYSTDTFSKLEGDINVQLVQTVKTVTNYIEQLRSESGGGLS